MCSSEHLCFRQGQLFFLWGLGLIINHLQIGSKKALTGALAGPTPSRNGILQPAGFARRKAVPAMKSKGLSTSLQSLFFLAICGPIKELPPKLERKGYLSYPSLYLVSAISYKGRHTRRFSPTTYTLIRPTPRTILGQSPCAVAVEM